MGELRHEVRAHDPQHSIGSDAFVSVAQEANILGRQITPTVQIRENHEIIGRAVAFGEGDLV